MYYLYVSANKIYLEALCRNPKSGLIAESGAPCKLVVESGAPETSRIEPIGHDNSILESQPSQ